MVTMYDVNTNVSVVKFVLAMDTKWETQSMNNIKTL